MYHFIMRFPDWNEEESFHVRLSTANFVTAKYEFLSFCNAHGIEWFPGAIVVDCFLE